MTTHLDSRRGQTSMRILHALAVGKNDIINARAYAAGKGPGWREPFDAIERAAVGAGSVAVEGVNLIGPVGNDLMPLVQPLELIGRTAGLRRVPFNIALTTTLSGTSASWVGEGKPAPLSKANYSRIATILPRKLVSMAAVTEELAKSADPDAQSALSQEFVTACVSASDAAWVDPSNAGIANVKPALQLHFRPFLGASEKPSFFAVSPMTTMAPRTRIERATCPLGGGRSIH